MLVQRDWLARLIKQLAEFIARALKLVAAGKRDDGLKLLEAACGELLGIEYRVLNMLDAKSAVELLYDPAKAMVFVRLLDAMAKIDTPEAAAARIGRAIDLLHEILKHTPNNLEAKGLLTELTSRE